MEGFHSFTSDFTTFLNFFISKLFYHTLTHFFIALIFAMIKFTQNYKKDKK